jgi:hypothetical protein
MSVLQPPRNVVQFQGPDGERDLRGAAADRPAATSVAAGTIYWSLDTGAYEWSDGTTWAPVTP